MATVGYELFQVDSFTDRAFSGNPAAVCLCPSPRDAAWMQKVAREMNLSETAFLVPRDDGYGLRWFTPTVEVEICGHATLASAHVLWESGRLPAGATARFHTLSGLLTAERRGGLIEMDFPLRPPEPVPVPPPALVRALGREPVSTGRFGNVYLLELESEAAVRAAQPDLELFSEVPARAAIVTARAASAAYDFVSRFFAPGSGIPEDPVTGGAHCILAPFWGPRLGKQEMLGYQASARGGTVGVRLAGDRVKLLGQAVTVLQGRLTV
jgi:PhzF family phenazine biosynthesis protein